MVEVEVLLGEKPQDAAARYYELAKKYKAKTAGVKKAMAETEKAIAALEKEKEAKTKTLDKERGKVRVRESRKREWFEAFHWFRTSTGFLAVAGRDAQQNDLLYSKHVEPQDLFFHADVQGAPATVLKTEGKTKELDEQTAREVAQFAASYSRAWKQGLGSCDVYYVRPEQVSKSSHGEYLGKGAFMIKGERNWVRGIPLGLLVAEEEGRAVALPAGYAKPPAKSVRISPGSTGKRDAAERIKKAVGISDVDEVVRCLPGDCDFV